MPQNIVYASFLLDEGVKYDQTCLYQKCSIIKAISSAIQEFTHI